MNQKKLTDEEIVKALDICYTFKGCTNECPYFNKNGRNFCVENKALYKDMKRIVQEHAEQKAEIERLNAKYHNLEINYNATWEDFRKYEVENAELQKQVDELKEERDKLQDTLAEILIAIHVFKEEQPKAEGKARDLIDEMKQQTVKDTAKEICDLILEHWEKGELIECDWLRVAISERYGVEV